MERSSTLIDRDVRYAMLPVWFVCYEFEGKHNTIMVNGQTGKVVCGIPWNKKLFAGCVAGLSSIFTIFLTWFFGGSFLPALFESYSDSRRRHTSSSRDNNPVSVVIAGFMIAAAVFFVGYAVYKRVVKQLQLSQSKSIFNFMKKRQG